MTKILVVEDEPMIRELIDDILSLTNFEVILAENGQKGVELALNEHPDLILCDIMMPYLDGYGVLEEIQRHPETEPIPFVFLTAKGTKIDIRHGMNLGADDYLTKPFTEDELLQTISTRLKKRASVEQKYVQELQTTKEQLDHLLHYDSLTHLPNQLSLREAFNKITEAHSFLEAIQASKSVKAPVISVLYIGLDRFGRINENLGYEQGDLLLKAVAERLAECLKNRGAIAHLKGDEFAIILNPVGYKQTVEKLTQEIMDIFTRPFLSYQQEVFITGSIGISFYGKDGHKLEDLLQKANIAMKRVKYLGGNHYEMYSILLKKSPIPDYVELEADLRHALERGELEVHYQPVLNVKTGKIVGAEALARWYQPKRGSISPALFIAIAEETGLIDSIGRWVIKTAGQQGKMWQERGLGDIRVSVNLSGRQFNQLHLSRWVEEILRSTQLDSHLLELELTESVLVENTMVSIRKLNSLKALGVTIAIDDFGTGYSSLGYLQQFPFDVLKIDRCFIHDIDKNSKNAAITRTIISLAHQLNLRVVAEGIETKAELSFLAQNHCDEMQGYLLSRPVKASEFENLVKAQRKST